jgi:hypothetical protein
VELSGAAVPLIQEAPSVSKLVRFFIEYLNIKRSLEGEELTQDKIQTNENGDVTITNNEGEITYIDNRQITNVNLIKDASQDPKFNKNVEKIAQTLSQSKRADRLSFGDNEGNDIASFDKNEAPYFEYHEKIEENPRSTAGYIRQVNNRTHKGIVVIQDGESERSVWFELDIKNIEKLEQTVRNLAIAEGTEQQVHLIGEQVTDSEGKIKKIIVNEVEIPDRSFDF